MIIAPRSLLQILPRCYLEASWNAGFSFGNPDLLDRMLDWARNVL
jgi:hypothetical protein